MASPRAYSLTALALVVALSGACTGNSPLSEGEDSASAPSATEVAVVNIAYAPETVTIEAGTEVLWVNEDEAVHHTVTSGEPGDNGVPGVSKGKKARPDGTFDGDLPEAPAEFMFTFDKPGTYAYFCKIHPSMTGEIVVE